MIKTRFQDFINEQYTLTIEDSMDDFEMKEIEWELEYNVTDIWNKYNKDKNTTDSIKKYKNILISKKDRLI